MLEAGILDPTKVTRLALQNAASVAGLLLTTEVMIAEAPKDEEHGHGWWRRHAAAWAAWACKRREPRMSAALNCQRRASKTAPGRKRPGVFRYV